jgi:hypothetical protein
MMAPQLENYLRYGSKHVEGWLEPGAARFTASLASLQDKLGVSGPIAEIGVHHGKFFVLLALTCSPGQTAVAVDLFEHQTENITRSGHGNRDIFLRNCARNKVTCVIEIISANSNSISGGQLVAAGRQGFRLFSVDGGHDPETTCHDLSLAQETLSDGGVVILDDFFNELWPGVADGTLKFLTQSYARLVPFAIGGNKMWLADGSWAEIYRSHIRELSTHAVNIAEHKFLGRTVTALDFRPLRAKQKAKRMLRKWIPQRTLSVSAGGGDA